LNFHTPLLSNNGMKTQRGYTMKSAEFKQLLIGIGKLNHQQRQKLAATLKQPTGEAKVFELIGIQFEVKKACPHCASTELYRHGVVDGLQRYCCKQCHKTFNALTGTPLARLREKPKWLGYLAAMAQSLTVRKSAAEVGVHRNTSFRWRHRFLEWISQDRPAKLHGTSAPCGYHGSR
jgi:transposase-like protein